MLEICLLGSGGMMPLPGRYLTALAVRYNGKIILIDCGEGTQVPLRILGWGLKNLDIICLTHFHADHVAGLPGLLLSIGNCDRDEPIDIYGPKNLQKVVDGLTVVTPELPFGLNLTELSYKTLSDRIVSYKIAEDLKLSCFYLNHSTNCFGYSLELSRKGKFNLDAAKALNIPVHYWKVLQNGNQVEFNGKIYTPDMVMGEARKGLKVTYVTDTIFFEEIASFAENSDIFICEGLHAVEEREDKTAQKKHMTFTQAATLAKLANVGELWLTHFSPALIKPEQYINLAAEIFPNTVIGKSLLKRTLTFEEN